MYSYEDRIRAVELYIKLGKRVRPTIRQLGYPTKNSLKGWFREYEQRLDLPAGYAGREPVEAHRNWATFRTPGCNATDGRKVLSVVHRDSAET